MTKKLRYLFTLLLCMIASVGWGQTTYKLEQVTSVQAGELYVFEQNGHVAINTVSNSALQTTTDYKTSGLTGTETYVWELKNGSKGFRISSMKESSNEITNTSSTTISLKAEGSNWKFTFENGVALIQNIDNNNRYLGYSTTTSYAYKAYATSDMSYSHAIKVYKLVEESGTTPVDPSVTTTTTINATGITNTDVNKGTAAGNFTASVTVTDDGSPVEGATVTWSGNNDDVATIDAATGAVTLVAAGTVTFTASYAGVQDEYKASSATYELTVEDSAPKETITFSEKGLDNGTAVTTIEGTIFAVTFDKGTNSNAPKYYTTGTAIRAYGGNTFIVSSTSKTITIIVLTFGNDDGSNEITTDVGSYTSGTWTGESSSVKFTIGGSSGNRRISAITVYYKDAAIAVPVFTLAEGTYTGAQTVEITCATTDATIMYSKDNENWTEYTEAISVASSTTVYAKAVKGTDESNVVSATYTIIDPYASGQANNPYTVDQAIENTPATGNTDEVYVKGIVSKVDNYDSSHHSITYWISANGTTDGNQVEVYSGKGIDGANFSSINDIQVGDIVVVKGTLKKYNDITEFNYNNQLVSLDRPEKPKHWAKFFVDGEELVEDAVEIQEGQNITFPEDPDDINGKTFVGWITNTIDGTTNTAPAFVTSASMGNSDVTYYAVFAIADATGESVETKTQTLQYDTWTYSGTTTDKSSYRLFGNGSYIESISFDLSKLSKVIVYGGTYGGGGYNSLTIGDGTNIWKSVTVSGSSQTGTNTYTDGTSLTGTNKLRITATAGDGKSNGLRISKVEIFTNEPSIVYSDYCTTVVAPVKPAKPIVFHDGGEGVTYEGELTVPMFAEEGATIYYTTDGTEPTAASTEYTKPLNISTNTTLKAIAVKDGVESDVVTREYRIEAVDAPDINLDGYYSIKNNNGNYVNVAGRKTVTFVDKNTSKTAAGTVIRVKTTNGKVEVLRSQGVDVPRYAERAMSYVPELVKELMKRLSENVENPIIGEDGANLITDEVMDLDYNLYLEEADGGYRIYGKTPSMQRVVDFYATNKTIIDERLPRLEEFVEDVLLKVAERLDHPNSEWASKFKILDIWAKLVVTNPDLTKPEEGNAEAISKFYTEILSSEANIWNFAHETMMIYWTKVDQLINDPESQYASMLGDLGDYKKYLEKVPNIRPNFKYYIVSDGSGIDFISEGNEDIINDAARTVWTLEGRENFNVTFLKDNALSSGRELYTTLYTDFAYKLPDGVKAYAITGVNETTGVATKEEFPSNIIPAQTPVLLQATFDAEQTADQTKTLELTTEAGTTPETNLLVGADYLINEYEINSPTAEGMFTILATLSQSLADKYEYLQRKNSGTVNNKYFFALDNADLDLCVENKDCVVRNLGTGENQPLAFYGDWQAPKSNQAFLVSETFNPILLTLKGDVYRDGVIDNKDLTALVEIVLGKVTLENKPENYDFDAAHVNEDEDINIADVTALVNILKPQPQD